MPRIGYAENRVCWQVCLESGLLACIPRIGTVDVCLESGLLACMPRIGLLTSRPIRIEDSRNVRGRREAQEESGARRRDSAVLSPAPRGPCC
ncbi:hypothetical protein NDU88_000364 [Pleurodeles waltl]|uniref:Uncharacterized protein n=1 Tax=Pleurodeles waltl TaxID=8319 RepID=A0AAV7WJ62_PLEWA|nr:hypothetical protein NDU88_000364 [Pleurodeles waltl]